MGRTQIVEHGPPALAALRATIDELQGGRPLAPVTVVVPSNSVGVGTRRWLAANGGIAAVRFVTVYRLAELLGGPALVAAGRRPVSTPVVDVAVRRALAAAPGMFGPVAHHHATVTALREAHRELRHVPAEAMRRMERQGTARTAEILRIHRAVSRTLAAQWYDEADLLEAAVANLPADAAPTVVHLPHRLRPTEERLLDALDARTIEGSAPTRLDGGIELVDTSDADEEVREVVRRIVAAADHGVAFERIAVVWPVSDPYARLLTEQLDAAGIPWNGRPGVTLHERLAARLVLDVLAVDRRGMRRADLFGVLAHVPARTSDGRRVPTARWERTSRAAGLAGAGDWDVRLAHHERSQRARGHEAEAADAAALRGFVADLRARLGSPTTPAPWSHWAAVATDLLDRWLGGPRRIAELPAAEHEAYVQVEAAVQRLGRLDELDEPITRPVFVDALAAELDAAPARVGRIGDGVQCGPLSFAAGQALEQVYVLGAVEGQLPGLARADPLLGDADRALAGGALALSDDAVADQHDELIAAISAARRARRPASSRRPAHHRRPTAVALDRRAGHHGTGHRAQRRLVRRRAGRGSVPGGRRPPPRPRPGPPRPLGRADRHPSADHGCGRPAPWPLPAAGSPVVRPHRVRRQPRRPAHPVATRPQRLAHRAGGLGRLPLRLPRALRARRAPGRVARRGAAHPPARPRVARPRRPRRVPPARPARSTCPSPVPPDGPTSTSPRCSTN